MRWWARLRARVRRVALPRGRVALTAIVLLAGAVPAIPASAATFTDTTGNAHEVHIDAIASVGVTTGCGGGRYCPAGLVTRAEMATFLARTLGLADDHSDMFSDDDGDPHEARIDAVAEAGITAGCGGNRYCPDGNVTRAEMATFLARAGGLADGTQNAFSDDDGNPHEGRIDAIAAAGITSGCADGLFCPAAAVRRDEMATFLYRLLQRVNPSVLPPEPPAPPPGPPPPPPGEPTDPPTLAGCEFFPPGDPWNTDVSSYPLLAGGEGYIDAIGRSTHFHADWGDIYGIPYNVVPNGQPHIPVWFDYWDETDNITDVANQIGGYPIPDDPNIEDGSDAHILIVEQAAAAGGACTLWEIFAANETGGTYPVWEAGSGARFYLDQLSKQRPDSWTSADAAGLPILAGLVRYDEAASGEIRHALRFTANDANGGYIHPATHCTGECGGSAPPMGLRLRLRADYPVDGFSPLMRTVVVAMQRYGIILADNGSDWYVTGAPDARWGDGDLVHELDVLTGDDFEVVDTGEIITG